MSHTGVMEVISDEAISAIVATVEPSSTVVRTSTLPGGLSSWMTTIEIERPDGSRHRLVVRRGRRPDAQRHTLPFGVEFELLGYLDAHGLPVARPSVFDDSARILPQTYVVLDFVEGATRFTTDDPVGMAVQMADVLAAIHDVDPTSASLPALPLHLDRMQEWVITDLDRRPPDPSLREDLVRHHLHEHLATTGNRAVPSPRRLLPRKHRLGRRCDRGGDRLGGSSHRRPDGRHRNHPTRSTLGVRR